MDDINKNTEKQDQFAASGDLFAVSNEPVQENTLTEAVPLDHIEEAKPLDQAETVKPLDSIASPVSSASTASPATSVSPVSPVSSVSPAAADQAQSDLIPVKGPAAQEEKEPVLLHEQTEEAKPLPAAVSNPVSTASEPAKVSEPVSTPAADRETEEKTAVRTLPQRKLSLPHSANLTSLGAFLTAARNAAGMSVEQVAEHTLIRIDYICAMEEDNLKKLPPIIFIKAYGRSLRDLYQLDDDACASLNKLLEELQDPADVPEKVIDEINQNVQINEEEAKKVRRTGYYLLSALGVLLLLIIALVVYFSVTHGRKFAADQTETIAAEVKNTVKAEKKEFTPEDLNKLLPPVIPEERIMGIPADRKRRR